MMARRGRGRRGRPRGTGQAPSVFDQQTFTEAVGIAATAIAQASVTGSQRGPSCKTPTLLNVIIVVVELIRGPMLEARVD